jgi:hypothetical protein
MKARLFVFEKPRIAALRKSDPNKYAPISRLRQRSFLKYCSAAHFITVFFLLLSRGEDPSY